MTESEVLDGRYVNNASLRLLTNRHIVPPPVRTANYTGEWTTLHGVPARRPWRLRVRERWLRASTGSLSNINFTAVAKLRAGGALDSLLCFTKKGLCSGAEMPGTAQVRIETRGSFDESGSLVNEPLAAVGVEQAGAEVVFHDHFLEDREGHNPLPRTVGLPLCRDLTPASYGPCMMRYTDALPSSP
jgi:hypothetical protein